MFQVKFNNGAVLTLRETSIKSGKKVLAVRPADQDRLSAFGFNVDLANVGGSLPTSGELLEDGKVVSTFSLERSVTKDFTDKKTGKVSPGGKPKVQNDTAATIKFGDDELTLKVRISQPQDSTANVNIRAIRSNSGGGAKLVSLA